MIRLTGSGPEVVKDDGWAELREVFERRHCVLLEDFLSCFASVLGAEYAYRGDLRTIEGPTEPFVAETFSDGRPIKAPIMMLLRRTATEIEHLRSIRLLGVLGIALLAWCVLLPRVSGFRTALTGAKRRRRTGIRKRP